MKWKLLKRRMMILLSALVITSSVTVYAEVPEEIPQEQADETEEKPKESESPEDQPKELSDPVDESNLITNTETLDTNPSTEIRDTNSSTENPDTPSNTETNQQGYNFYSGMPNLYKKTETDTITALPNGDRYTISTRDGITTISLNLLEGFAANEKYCLDMAAYPHGLCMYVGKYDSADEAENADSITLGTRDYYEADYSTGVLFTYFYEGEKYYVNFIAVPYKSSPDSSSSSDNASATDSSTDSSRSSSSDNASTTDSDNTVSVPLVISDVKTAGADISVAGFNIKTSVAGLYAAKEIQGAAVTNLYTDVRSKLQLSDSQTPYIMIFDTDTKKSNKAMDSINAAITALGNVKIAAILNIDLGARELGKYVSLSEGSVSIVVGLPKDVDTTKSISIIYVRPGGEIAILEDTDTNPNTVTFEIQAGLGTYAIVTK